MSPLLTNSSLRVLRAEQFAHLLNYGLLPFELLFEPFNLGIAVFQLFVQTLDGGHRHAVGVHRGDAFGAVAEAED